MMAALHDVRFPDSIARGASGGPGFSTAIVETTGGREGRQVNWSQARGKWNVGTGLRRRADFVDLIAFFRARMGRAYGFRFKDWADFTATGSAIGAGDGAAKTFQLAKTYTSGPTTVSRTITRPVAGTVLVYVGGVLQSSGVAVNAAAGIVTFTAAPANGAAITATFEFDVPVRFDTDDLALTLESYEIGQWPEVPVVEVRE